MQKSTILSSDFLIIDQDNYQVSIPFQNIVQHIGGQINSNNDEPLTTIFNNATGIKLEKPFNSKLIKKLILSSFIVNYQDLSPQKRQLFIDIKTLHSQYQHRKRVFYQTDHYLNYLLVNNDQK